MSKFNVAKKVTEITKKLQEDTANYDSMVKEENKELTNAIINIGSKEGGSGGAGTGVVVRTPAYNKWLAAVQARNPFIGQSYMQRAEEYERDDEEAKEQTQMEDVDAAKIMFKDSDGTLHIRDDYDPNSIDEEVENEKLTGDASKLADLCEINKIVANQITWDFDSLLKEVEAKLEEIHADEDDYELPENLAEQLQSSINHAKSVAAITYAREHKEATNGEKEK